MIRAMNNSSEKPSEHNVDAVNLITIDGDQAGQRLDNFLIARLKGVPRSKVYNVIRKGEVRVNKGRIKPEYKIKAGDVIRIPPIRTAEAGTVAKASFQMMALLDKSILYEDDGLLVISKPPGLAVHGGSGVTLGLIETLRQMRPSSHHLELVHRLDRDTSGCIMIAKKRSYLRHLQAALREKSAGAGGVHKVYQALVNGDWSKRRHEVNAPLMKFEIAGGERVVKVHPDGKPSLTQFSILQRFEGFTLMEARPITGRTHQIRVHAQFAGHSLAGDEKYGDDGINEALRGLGLKRLFLHASSLSFYLPDSDQLTTVNAPLPADLYEPLSKLIAK